MKELTTKNKSTNTGNPVAEATRIDGVPRSLPRKALYGKNSCEITQRDLAIFSYLERYGVATLGQLWVIFFQGIRLDTAPWLFLDKPAYGDGPFSAAYLRLRKLASAGFLERHKFPVSNFVYVLTAAGHWQLSKRGLSKIKHPPPGVSKINELRHSLLLTACGAIFEKAMGFPVKTERELYSEKCLREGVRMSFKERSGIPDLEIEWQGRILKVELELTLKSEAQRYRNYWQSLGAPMRGQAPCLLYITGTQLIQDRLQAISREEYCPGMFVSDLNSFKSTLSRSPFINSLDKTMVFFR